MAFRRSASLCGETLSVVQKNSNPPSAAARAVYSEPQPEAGGAARPALRLALQAARGGREGRAVVLTGEQRHLRVQLAQDAQLVLQPQGVLRLRLDVGVIIEQRDREVRAEHLQHGRRAGPAAALQQQGGPAAAEGGHDLIHFQRIVLHTVAV